MSVLFNLPDDCIDTIFTEWLDLGDWRHMDQACSLNHGLSKIMNQILGNLMYREPVFVYEPCMETIWVMQRKIRLCSVYLNDCTRSLPDINWSEVTHLDLKDALVAVEAIGLCPKLNKLSIKYNFVDWTKVEPASLSNLTDLEYYHAPINWKVMEPLALYCRRLRRFVLEATYQMERCPFVIPMLKNNPQLTCLDLVHFRVDDATMKTIGLQCKQLTALNLKCALDIDANKLIELHSQLKLKQLIICDVLTVTSESYVMCITMYIQHLIPLLRHVCPGGVKTLIVDRVRFIRCDFLKLFLDFSRDSLVYYKSKPRCTFDNVQESQLLLLTCPYLKACYMG